MKTPFIERVSGAADFKLPASMSREIGRIIVHWAYFEQCVQQMNWQTLDITPAAGRLALREPRVENRLEMLHDLVKLREGEWDDKLYRSILTRTKLATAKRDLIAHGLWAKRDEGWYVELTRGVWPKNLRQLVTGSRKVTTQLIPMDTDKLREATNEIASLIEDLGKLRESALAKPGPSPHIHR